MKYLLLTPVVLLTLFIAACEAIPHDMLLELNPPDEESDLSVSQLIERVREATDPKGVYLNCNGYILRQTAISKEKRGKTVVDHYTVTEKKFRQPGQMRQTTYQNGIPVQTLLFKDNKAWIIDKNGKAEEYNGQGMELFKNYIGFSDPKATEQTLFSTVELGVVYLDGIRTYRMICRTSDPNLPPYVEYIDAKTFLPVRLETIQYTADGRQLRYTAEPQDYRWVSNVLIPTVTLVTVGENKTEEYETTEFMINPNLSELDFQVNEGTKIDMLRTK
ncbi:MAG: hypothetical protein J6S98_00110 [Lentisphaeria bacterium]|nr:hypothetical protein [Lentisphaeria bacterium]MBR4883830.1 hypothetical protein [Lentisphaeria bacterium]